MSAFSLGDFGAGSDIGGNISFGLTTGIVLALTTAAVILPASYIMNRFIYHTGPMRTLMGVVAAAGSVFSLVALLAYKAYAVSQGQSGTVHYFGLLPIFLRDMPTGSSGSDMPTGSSGSDMPTGSSGSDMPTGSDASFLKDTVPNYLWDMLRDPVSFLYDKEAYTKVVSEMVDMYRARAPHLPEGVTATTDICGATVTVNAGCVSEAFFAEARRIGTLGREKWGGEISSEKLRSLGETIFAGVATTQTPTP
jgi:hypothetical protein